MVDRQDLLDERPLDPLENDTTFAGHNLQAFLAPKRHGAEKGRQEDAGSASANHCEGYGLC